MAWYADTPYGERTAYKPLDGNDTYGTLEIGETQAVVVATVAQPYGLCDLGHQGLFLDKEWKAYDNRNRVLVATLGRFAQRDPSGYEDDEMSLYLYVFCNPVGLTDPSGLGGGPIEREWPSQIPRNISLEELKQQLRCATGAQKSALAKAKKLLQQKARIQNKGQGRMGGTTLRTLGLVVAVASIILTETSVADAHEIDWRDYARSDQCVVCSFSQIVEIDPRPEGLGHVLDIALSLTVGAPEPYAAFTGVRFYVLMSERECADLDFIADFVDRDTGQTKYGYSEYASRYYRTRVVEVLPQKVCECACPQKQEGQK